MASRRPGHGVRFSDQYFKFSRYETIFCSLSLNTGGICSRLAVLLGSRPASARSAAARGIGRLSIPGSLFRYCLDAWAAPL
jgi:hypothetical protein